MPLLGHGPFAVRISGPFVTNDVTSFSSTPLSPKSAAMASVWLAAPELKSGRLTPVLLHHPVAATEAIDVALPSARLVPPNRRIFRRRSCWPTS